MKKLMLFMGAVALSGTVMSQEAKNNMLSVRPVSQNNETIVKHDLTAAPVTVPKATSDNLTKGARTTLGGGRWYDYGANWELLQPAVLIKSNTGLSMWQDTTAIYGWTGGSTVYSPNQPFVSLGLSLHPWLSAWNDNTNFPGEIAITHTDAYTIDSVGVYFGYDRNYSKPTVVDTLVVTFVSGNLSSTADLAMGLGYGSTVGAHYGVARVNFPTMYHDSLQNHAAHSTAAINYPLASAPSATGGTVVTYKFPLKVADTNTSATTVGGNYFQFPRYGRTDGAINVPVPAGSISGASVSFRSGDAHPFYPAKDTVRYSDGTNITGYKYGNITPLIWYSSDATPTPQFPPYDSTNFTTGYFKGESYLGDGGGGLYTPNWGWTSSTGGASGLQMPMIAFHVTCATCVTVGSSSLGANNIASVNSINAYPNPANDLVNIAFSLTSNANVTATLTNMLGQVVASKNMGSVTTGKVVFSTTELTNGVYFYELSANGTRSTGRVVVAH